MLKKDITKLLSIIEDPEITENYINLNNYLKNNLKHNDYIDISNTFYYYSRNLYYLYDFESSYKILMLLYNKTNIDVKKYYVINNNIKNYKLSDINNLSKKFSKDNINLNNIQINLRKLLMPNIIKGNKLKYDYLKNHFDNNKLWKKDTKNIFSQLTCNEITKFKGLCNKNKMNKIIFRNLFNII